MNNKELVRAAFERWATGSGSFFDLVDEHVIWTLSGSARLSRTYTSKKELTDSVLTPLNERLSEPIRPQLRQLYEDGNTIIAIWDGKASARDGQAYNVSYAWFMEMRNGMIVKVTAFLDTLDFEDIFRRVRI
jgi:uncharacterized protein